jgi:Allene oxide cyclase barrel like domain
MRARIVAAVLAAVMLVAGVAAFALAARPQARITEPETLSFVSITIATGSIDADPVGASTGDQQTSSARLMRHGQRVGSLDATCSFTLPTLICRGVVRVQEGQITIQGQLRRSVLQGASHPITIAITGGTGAFRNAHGWVTITQTAANTQRVVLHLLP